LIEIRQDVWILYSCLVAIDEDDFMAAFYLLNEYVEASLIPHKECLILIVAKDNICDT
jgi:hypothetical protein